MKYHCTLADSFSPSMEPVLIWSLQISMQNSSPMSIGRVADRLSLEPAIHRFAVHSIP